MAQLDRTVAGQHVGTGCPSLVCLEVTSAQEPPMVTQRNEQGVQLFRGKKKKQQNPDPSLG